MSRVCVFLADGFEEIEGLTVVDILRRAGVEVSAVSITDEKMVTGSHGIRVEADARMKELDFKNTEMLVLPGGMPGTKHLRADERVCDIVRDFAATKHVAAICAAPSILGELGVLEGHRATCFPGFEDTFPAGVFAGPKSVVVDGNIITASAMGQALPFALAVLGDIAGDVAVEKVREGIQL